MNTATQMGVRTPRQPMIWSGGDRVVACAGDGSVVGTFSTVAEAQRAVAGSTRRQTGIIGRRPRSARAAV